MTILPYRELALGTVGLLAQGTPGLPDATDVKNFGIYVIVLMALLWVIYQERNERKDMRDGFAVSLKELSESIRALGKRD